MSDQIGAGLGAGLRPVSCSIVSTGCIGSNTVDSVETLTCSADENIAAWRFDVVLKPHLIPEILGFVAGDDNC